MPRSVPQSIIVIVIVTGADSGIGLALANALIAGPQRHRHGPDAPGLAALAQRSGNLPGTHPSLLAGLDVLDLEVTPVWTCSGKVEGLR